MELLHPTRLFVRKITSSLFFIPLASLLVSIILGILTIQTEHLEALKHFNVAWEVDVDTLRDFLTSSASIVMSIAGVTFSVVIVALTLASNQFCPRVLQLFVEDPVNRKFFGIVLGNFVFDLTLLAGTSEQTGSSAIMLIACFLYTIVSTVYFIYFIHHTAISLQVDNIVRAVVRETEREIKRVKRKDCVNFLGPALPLDVSFPRPHFDEKLSVKKGGYVQAAHGEPLIKLSESLGETVTLLVADGDFVVKGMPLIEKPSRELTEEEAKLLQNAFELGSERYLANDISYGFRVIVDIAIKAISPAINDPTTATFCVDSLTSLMVSLMDEGWPPDEFTKENTSIRFERNGIEQYLRLCCAQITHFAVGSPSLLEALLRFLNHLAVYDQSAAFTREAKLRVQEILESLERSELSVQAKAPIRKQAADLLKTFQLSDYGRES